MSSSTSSSSAGSSSSSSSTNVASNATCNSDPVNGVSLCIPRVFNNIGWRRIKQTFVDLRWGYVDRVDVISLGKNKRAFVHFAPGRWNTRDQEAMEALKALQNGDEVKVLYDEPWYWKISISKSAKPDESPKPRTRPTTTIGRKPTIDLAESKEPEDGEIKEGNNPITARIASVSPRTRRAVIVKTVTAC